MRPRVVSLLKLAMPIVAARASQSVLTLADALQVKDHGTQAIAAVATGGLNVLCLAVLPSGTAYIVQSFVAQLVGRGKRDSAPRFAWYGLAIALIAGLGACALMPLVRPALSLGGYSSALGDSMASYMTIRMWSIGAIVGSEAMSGWFGGLGNTRMQAVAGAITMVTAVACNWVFIDGHLGAPALGVDGAALASTIASWLGFAFLLLGFARGWGGAPRGRGSLRARELWRVIRFGFPYGLNWFVDFTAYQFFINVVIGSLGDTTIAVFNCVLAVNSLAFMPALGLASAGGILAGHAIGRGKYEDVWPTLKSTLACTIGWIGSLGVIYLVVPEHILGLFAARDHGATELVAIGGSMLVMSALWEALNFAGITLSATLSAAGDTTWPTAVRIVLGWVLFSPAAYFVVRAWGGALSAIGCLVGYLALFAGALAWRYRRGKWRQIELIEPELV